MIRDENGNRMSPRRAAKEIVQEYLDLALINFWEANKEKTLDDMTALEITRVGDCLKDLTQAIIKRHEL